MGSGGTDRYDGGSGSDTLDLRAAVSGLAVSVAAEAQNLSARGGADTLWGGTGADRFVFGEFGSANADRVSDFAPGSDKLALDDAAFTAIGAAGNFSASDGRFWSSSSGTAHDASDRVIYNTSSGNLYYDADGNGSGAAQLIATVSGAPTVTASDIVVI